jgi:hypothetical protein
MHVISCIDQCDRAFALHGIARDGGDLVPSYNKSAADVFFRLLSVLPTEDVLPATVGHRWPHQAGMQLLYGMQLMKEDLLNLLAHAKDHHDEELVCGKDDRLYATFEFEGFVVGQAKEKDIQSIVDLADVPPFEGQRQNSLTETLYDPPNLRTRDLVYKFQTRPQLGPQTQKGIYVAFRATEAALFEVLLDKEWNLMRRKRILESKAV